MDKIANGAGGDAVALYRRRPLVVGIAGATNSGKTTIARRLLEEFPDSDIVHQDDFFRAKDDPMHEHVEELSHHNWDTISAVNFHLMLDSVQKKVAALEKPLYSSEIKGTVCRKDSSRPRLLIIEGILVFNVDDLARLMDRKYTITLTKEECRRRRLTRNYDPADVPGYFDLIVWPMYQKFAARLRDQHDEIKFFDGTDATENTLRAIREDILRYWMEVRLDSDSKKAADRPNGVVTNGSGDKLL